MKSYKELVDEVIKTLNNNKENLVFIADIIKPKASFTYKLPTGKEITTKNYRSFRIYCNDEGTGFRHLVYEDNFIPNKPDTFLYNHYKESLYRKFFINAGSIYANALFNNIKQSINEA